jgi:hypothetical protein
MSADLSSAWHAAYCRWYDADRAGRSITARIWGVVADGIMRTGDRLHLWGTTTSLTAGVNDGQGPTFPNGADVAPDKSKGSSYAAPAPAVDSALREAIERLADSWTCAPTMAADLRALLAEHNTPSP